MENLESKNPNNERLNYMFSYEENILNNLS